MDRTQADAVSGAILEPHLRAQDARSEEIRAKRAAEAALQARKRIAAWLALAGMAIGAAIAHYSGVRFVAGLMWGGLAGAALGMLLVWLGLGEAHAGSQFDRPSNEPVFMAMPNAALAEAARAASGTLPHFRTLLASTASTDAPPIVKTYIADPAGGGMWLWLSVDKATDAGFETHVFEAPPQFEQLSPGTQRFVPDEEVGDWSIIVAGVLHGGYSLRLQRARLPEAEREAYDRHIGAVSYAPLPAGK